MGRLEMRGVMSSILRVLNRRAWFSALVLIIACLAFVPTSVRNTFALTTIIPITASVNVCGLDNQYLQGLKGQIAGLQTEEQQLHQQLMQQPQNSINTANYVNKALVSDAALIRQVVNSMNDYGNKLMTDSDGSTKGIELYNAGFDLVQWANDLQKNDNFQQVTILLNFASLDASQQDWQDVIGNLNSAKQALTSDIQAISKDQTGIGRVYGLVLNNQLDPSGGSNPNGPLTQLLGLHHSLDPPIYNLEDLSSGEMSIDISQVTNILSVPGQIQTIQGKLSTLQNSYNQLVTKMLSDCPLKTISISPGG